MPRPRVRILLLAALALAAGLARSAAAAAPLDLLGTWYVWAHYRDSATNNPDFERWQDRIWVFREAGSRLEWTSYPIVIFSDETGRFDRLGTNRQSRVMQFWDPSPAQLDEIRSGLEVNPRGRKAKTLSGSWSEGWRSRGPIAAFGANTLTYTEIWSIEDPRSMPIFRIEESLGGARAETLEGVTLYQVEEVEPGGEVLHGSFDRDGTRTGTFTMMRAGAVSDVKGSGRSNDERVMAMFASQMGGGEELAAILSAGKPAQLQGTDREKVRAEIRKMVEDSMREQDIDPRYYQSEVRDLTEQILRAWERGRSPQQIERMLREGEIAPETLRPGR